MDIYLLILGGFGHLSLVAIYFEAERTFFCGGIFYSLGKEDVSMPWKGLFFPCFLYLILQKGFLYFTYLLYFHLNG